MSSTLLKQIRRIRTKEQFLTNLISNLENLINFCSKQYGNNVDAVLLEESGGEFKFTIDNFRKIRVYFKIHSSNFDFSQNSLSYANVLWEMLLKIKYKDDSYSQENIFDISRNSFSFSGNEFSAIVGSLNESEYYFIDFEPQKGFEFSDEKYLIDVIEDEKLSSLFYLYKNSKNFNEKENHISAICKKLVFLFSDKDSPSTYNFIKSKIGIDKAQIICGRMHGYFRHTENDSNGAEAIEWATFDEGKKLVICDETFIDLLHILASLRIKDLLPEIK